MAKIYFAVAVEQLELITAFEEELLRLEARPELRAQNKQLATLAREMMQARGVTTKDGAISTHFEAGERVRQTIEAAGLATPEHLATPSKSYRQLLKEQKMRLRLKLEDALGLWAQLQDGTTDGNAGE